jgi:hypothetical protein
VRLGQSELVWPTTAEDGREGLQNEMPERFGYTQIEWLSHNQIFLSTTHAPRIRKNGHPGAIILFIAVFRSPQAGLPERKEGVTTDYTD